MDLFLDFPLTTLFALAVAAWVAWAVTRRWRRGAGRPAGASCSRCGASLPAVARFCRNCGQRVVG